MLWPSLYDTGNRSMIQNPVNDSARSSLDKLKTNADGSIDFYFGPKSPAGMESNWIQTIPGQGLLPDVPLLQPDREAVRRDMEAAGRRVDEVTLQDM